MITCDWCQEQIKLSEGDRLMVDSTVRTQTGQTFNDPDMTGDFHPECIEPWKVKVEKVKGARPAPPAPPTAAAEKK